MLKDNNTGQEKDGNTNRLLNHNDKIDPNMSL